MSQPSTEFNDLVAKLEAGQITSEEFELQSAKLIGSIGTGEVDVQADPVRLEDIDAAASMIKNL
jgi:hypothetical protein